jgi:hypothetical protein
MSDTPNRWSQEITESDRHDVASGVFAEGSAQEIADAVISAAREEGSGDVERRAMAKLTFYENRAGRNLTPERRAIIDEAKEIVRASF